MNAKGRADEPVERAQFTDTYGGKHIAQPTERLFVPTNPGAHFALNVVDNVALHPLTRGKTLMKHTLACDVLGTPTGPSYGSPFAETPARYTFWANPALHEGMPLLAVVATMALTAQGAAMGPERLHPAIGMLTRKFRAKTTPENAEMMTLARHWLLKDQAAKLAGLDIGELDAMECAEEGAKELPAVA